MKLSEITYLSLGNLSDSELTNIYGILEEMHKYKNSNLITGSLDFAYMEMKSRKLLIDDKNAENDEEILLIEGIKPAFGSPGGKFFMAGQLVRMIPEHKVYVEAFIGGGSLFYRKKPSEKEVINDFDKDIFFCHKFMQGYDENDMSELKQKNWTISKDLFHRLKQTLNEQVSRPEHFYRITMLKAYSDAGEMTSYDDRKNGSTLQILKRVPLCRERLKDVIILNKDYSEVVKEFDGPDTFFYLDPPYPKAAMSWKYMPTQEEIEKVLNSIKGKFLFSYEICPGFKGFNRRTIKTQQIANPSKPQDKIEGWKKELLVANYPFKNYDQFMTESLEITDRYFQEQVDPYMNYPDEEKKYSGIFQHHYRGKSVHLDQRNEGYDGNKLIAWTINDSIAGKIKEPVLTLEQAKDLDKQDIFKINYQSGKWKTKLRKVSNKAVNVQILSEKKQPSPHNWIDVEGVVKPGDVGATAELPAVFTIILKGQVEYGAQKLLSHEYFYNIDPIKYRIVYRQIKLSFKEAILNGNTLLESVLINNLFNDNLDILLQESIDDPYHVFESIDLAQSGEIIEAEKFKDDAASDVGWVAIKPIDQTPYVLSSGAENKNWLPPSGISAMPKKIREKVPDEMRYWEIKEKDKALTARASLRKHFSEIDFFKEARHRRDQCMECVKPPVYELLWAEGMGHAWFCKEHLTKWSVEHKGDIDYIKEVKDGKAAKKFSDNTNPNIDNKVLSETFAKIYEFVIQHRWWDSGIKNWDLRIDTGSVPLIHMLLESDPRENNTISLFFKPCRDRASMIKGKTVERIKPGTTLNPIKDMQGWISIIASGKVSILEDTDTIKKFEFKGNNFNGIWSAKREAANSEFWIFEKENL